MDFVKRSKKIHMVVEEKSKRKPSKVLVVEPKPEDSFSGINTYAQDLLKLKSSEGFISKSEVTKLEEDLEKSLAKEAKYKDYYSPIKVPNSDEIIKFTEKSEPEPSLTYEKMKEALEKFKATNFVVAKGKQINKTRMVFPTDLEGMPIDFDAIFEIKETATGRLSKKEKQAKAEALLENARRTPGNYWVTGDGRRIPISEMSDKNLVNTIRQIFKKVDSYPSKVIQEAYQQLVGQKPWMPKAMFMQRLVEFEIDGFCQDVFNRFPKLRTLIREATTRGLSLVKDDGQYQ